MQSSDDDSLRARAVARVTAKRELVLHAVIYVTVNLFLILIWALSDERGFFWPIWVLFGWGIGLAVHAAKVFLLDPSESAIDNEMRRMRGDR